MVPKALPLQQLKEDKVVGALRGLGHSIVPMIVSMVGACGVRLLWIATVFQTYHTPQVLFLSYPVSWAITAAVHIAFFLAVRKHAYRDCQRSNASPAA